MKDKGVRREYKD